LRSFGGDGVFGGQFNFGRLIQMVATAIKIDLMGMLKSYRGFGDDDNRQSPSGRDHGIDHSKKIGGYANNDQNQFKSSMKDLWKSHD